MIILTLIVAKKKYAIYKLYYFKLFFAMQMINNKFDNIVRQCNCW